MAMTLADSARHLRPTTLPLLRLGRDLKLSDQPTSRDFHAVKEPTGQMRRHDTAYKVGPGESGSKEVGPM